MTAPAAAAVSVTLRGHDRRAGGNDAAGGDTDGGGAGDNAEDAGGAGGAGDGAGDGDGAAGDRGSGDCQAWKYSRTLSAHQHKSLPIAGKTRSTVSKLTC